MNNRSGAAGGRSSTPLEILGLHTSCDPVHPTQWICQNTTTFLFHKISFLNEYPSPQPPTPLQINQQHPQLFLLFLLNSSAVMLQRESSPVNRNFVHVWHFYSTRFISSANIQSQYRNRISYTVAENKVLRSASALKIILLANEYN